VKGITDDRIKRLLGKGFVKGQEKTAEDGHRKTESPLVSLRTGKDPDSEKDEPGSHGGEKQQKDDPEQRAL
jgi:hypothetical protein